MAPAAHDGNSLSDYYQIYQTTRRFLNGIYLYEVGRAAVYVYGVLLQNLRDSDFVMPDGSDELDVILHLLSRRGKSKPANEIAEKFEPSSMTPEFNAYLSGLQTMCNAFVSRDIAYQRDYITSALLDAGECMNIILNEEGEAGHEYVKNLITEFLSRKKKKR